jgi:hypothetical protein
VRRLTPRRRRMRRAGVCRAVVPALAAVAAIVGAACSSGGGGLAPKATATATTIGGRPSSTAKLTIVSPRNGEVFRASAIPLKVSLRGATIVPATSTTLRPDEGHLHVILDDRLISMTSGLHETIPDVKPGTHLLRVEFVANDHAPFNPRVIEQVAFEVKA